MRKRSIITILVAHGTFLSAAAGQVQTDYDRLLRIGARASAMANAIVADARDHSAMFLNPAALTFLQSDGLFADHRGHAGHQRLEETIGVVTSFGDQNRLAMAVSFAARGRVYSGEASESRGIRYSMDLAQSILLARSFAAGIQAGVGVLRSSEIRILRIVSIVGLYYSPSPEIGYALTVGGLGIQSNLNPGSVPPVQNNLPPTALSIGMTMRFPSSYDRQDFTLALANEKHFGTAGLTYRVGLEYYVVPSIALRGGAVTGPFEHGARIGFGVRTTPLLFDIAFAPGGGDGRYQVSGFFRL